MHASIRRSVFFRPAHDLFGIFVDSCADPSLLHNVIRVTSDALAAVVSQRQHRALSRVFGLFWAWAYPSHNAIQESQRVSFSRLLTGAKPTNPYSFAPLSGGRNHSPVCGQQPAVSPPLHPTLLLQTPENAVMSELTFIFGPNKTFFFDSPKSWKL
jgi:hypothetical protein